jgi:hypothetical protein
MVLALPRWTRIREFRFISIFLVFHVRNKLFGFFFVTRAKPIFSSSFLCVNQFSLLVRAWQGEAKIAAEPRSLLITRMSPRALARLEFICERIEFKFHIRLYLFI